MRPGRTAAGDASGCPFGRSLKCTDRCEPRTINDSPKIVARQIFNRPRTIGAVWLVNEATQVVGVGVVVPVVERAHAGSCIRLDSGDLS